MNPQVQFWKKWLKRFGIAAVVATAAIVLFCIGVPIYIFGSDAIRERLNRKPFNAESWKKSGTPYGVIGVRLQMVDDLRKSHTLESKSRDEVVGLLGEPDGDPAVKPRFPDWQMHYYLGPSRGTVLFRGFDYDYLVLRLDQRGRVVAVGIVTLKT